MVERARKNERGSEPAGTPTRRQVLAAGTAVLGLPALAAVALTREPANLRLGCVELLDAATLTAAVMMAFGKAGVVVTAVPLASYGALADHLAAGASHGGVDGGIMPVATAERLAREVAIRMIGSFGAAGVVVLLEREARGRGNEGRQRLIAASFYAHMEAARRHWTSTDPAAVLLPPAQIGPNLRAGTIDLALLPERAAQALVDDGVARIAARVSEPGLTGALALRREWIAAYPSAARALRDALLAMPGAS